MKPICPSKKPGFKIKLNFFDYYNNKTNDMKKFLLAIAVLLISFVGKSQIMKGSIKRNADPTKLDIVFKADYSSVPNEHIDFLQFCLAMPPGNSAGVTATARGVNNFSFMGILYPITPYTETYGTPSTADDERIFGWVYVDSVYSTLPWTSGSSFKGVEVTFSTSNAASVVKMLDLSKTCTNPYATYPYCGGNNWNTFFVIASTKYPHDIMDTSSFFYSIPGYSQLGTYPATGDQYVETIPCSSPCSAETFTIQSSPNPFISSTKISYTLPKDDVVTLKVYNLKGDQVALLVNGFQTAGTKDVIFTADKLVGGIYIIRMQAGNLTESKKLILLR